MKNAMMPLRILVVDDDALSREVLALLLEHAGYAVETADSGSAAVERLAMTSGPLPDVVLADMQMPGTAGAELARQLRQRCGAATVLLAMSGSKPEDEAIRGFDGLLLKPFTMEELAAAITAKAAKAPDKAIPRSLTALDEAVYSKLAASMRRERLEQLYDLCLLDAEERITRMRQAASNQDDATYRKEAHALRGGTGMVGAVELQFLAAAMEENGLDANHVASLDEFILACQRLRRILRAHEADRQAGSLRRRAQ